jgi:hypothetical protein
MTAVDPAGADVTGPCSVRSPIRRRLRGCGIIRSTTVRDRFAQPFTPANARNSPTWPVKT